MPDKTSDLLAVAAYLTAIGRKGGSKRSEAKTKAARTNAKLGGRPRKPDSEIKPASLLRRQKREQEKENEK